MAASLLPAPVILAAFDPLHFVHEMDWYQHMLRAEWFQPLRPYWIDYHLDWVAAVILLGFLFWLARRLLRWLFADRSGGQRLAARSARKYEKNGELGLAAEAWRRAGKPQRAYRIYLEQQQWHQAAELAEQLQRPADAIAHLREAGDLAEAAAVAERAGILDQAAELHRQRGEPLAAARLYEKLGDPALAAQCYQEAGTWRRAAECYLAAGDQDAAVAAALELTRWYDAATVTSEETELFAEIAAYCEKQRQYARAARLYEAAGEAEKAATAYLAAQDKLAAARCLEQAGQNKRAAALYRELGRPDDWLRLQALGSDGRVDPVEKADALRAAGRHLEAAAALLEAGNRADAISIYREHDPAEAARLLAEDGRHGEAARAYLEAGQSELAEDQALRAGDLELAARAAERSGKKLEAARHLVELGRLEQAASLLQELGPHDADHREAASLLGSVLMNLGERELALEAARRAVAGLQPARDNLEFFYRLACLLEESSDRAAGREALGLYEKIVAVQLDFRDARQRRDRLRERLGSGPAG